MPHPPRSTLFPYTTLFRSDYVLPRADTLPMFTTEISEVPSTSNPLGLRGGGEGGATPALAATDRKSTRLNSSHRCISYAVFCLKKKKKTIRKTKHHHTTPQ